MHNDRYGGMMPTGLIIKDGWLFNLLPKAVTCEGWAAGQMQTLYEKEYADWEPYGHMISLLPDDL